MQARGHLTPDGVRAFNLIDVVFAESPAAKDAWAELYNAYSSNMVPAHENDRLLKSLIRVITEDIGLSDKIRTDDLGRVYYPNFIAEQVEIEARQRRQAIARLREEQDDRFNPPLPGLRDDN